LTWVIYIIAILAGLIIGSFLNVVIHRGPFIWGLIDGPERGNLATPRSYCPNCKTQLTFINLIPVFSYIFQNGKCVYCKTPINIRYPIVELLGALSAALALFTFDLSTAAITTMVLCWFLIALAVIDFETGYLPDALTLPLLAIGLGVNAVATFVPFPSALIGAVTGYGFFRLIGFAFQKLRGHEGLGQGDAKFLAAAGAWLGWQSLPFVILIGSLTTLLVIIFKSGFRAPAPDLEIPFGPGLCFATAMVILSGLFTIAL